MANRKKPFIKIECAANALSRLANSNFSPGEYNFVKDQYINKHCSL